MFDRAACTYDGIRLWGRVREVVVAADADITVEIVMSGEDLRVQLVDHPATSCGVWRLVDIAPDFTFRVVRTGGDLRIRIVQGFPGNW